MSNQLQQFINQRWEQSIIPTLMQYLLIPNKSPAFDSAWEANGYMEQAVSLIADWCRQQTIRGLQLEVVRLPGRTPLLFIEIPGQNDATVLLYGHLDKQPEMTGWDPDLSPWQGVLKGDKLYGRGGADDGYSAFASLCAIEALQQQGIPHSRCLILIEACEESGSYDLPFYMEHLKDRIKTPELIICLDSGCGNYDQLWCTTSLRGVINAELNVEVLTEGVHSGYGTGIIPCSFRILRQLLSRIEDENTGAILLPELSVDIPAYRVSQAQLAADVLGADIVNAFPRISPQLEAVSHDPQQLILNRTWRPALCVTGMGGIPSLENAGNVLRASTTAKLSLRLAPTCDPAHAGTVLQKALEQDPPYGARVTLTVEQAAQGWDAPATAPWLATACEKASMNVFGKPPVSMGEGGSIPFMGMLGQQFPNAQFVITGVLGPHSNAHGPNEFLHIPMGKKLTCCVAQIIGEHFQRS